MSYVRGLLAAGLMVGLGGPVLAKTKIASIGASTTQGSGAPAGQSYPDQLQKLLGAEYEVRNFGKSGAGALRAGNPTYWNSAEQKAAAAFAPDIVVNWLGGADSKAASWDAHKGEFLGDYKAMIKYYQDLPSHPKIISLMSIALHDDEGVRKVVLEGEVNPLQRQGALEMGSRFIDTKMVVDGHPEYFADGVHLKAIGYAAIAKAVETEVRALAAEADAGVSGGSDAAAVSDGGAAEAGGVPVPAIDAAVTPVVDAATSNPDSSRPSADASGATPPGSKRDAGTSPGTGGGSGAGKASSGGCAVAGSRADSGLPLALMLAALTLTLSRLRRARANTQGGPGPRYC